jgi:hypothetical protein
MKQKYAAQNIVGFIQTIDSFLGCMGINVDISTQCKCRDGVLSI